MSRIINNVHSKTSGGSRSSRIGTINSHSGGLTPVTSIARGNVTSFIYKPTATSQANGVYPDWDNLWRDIIVTTGQQTILIAEDCGINPTLLVPYDFQNRIVIKGMTSQVLFNIFTECTFTNLLKIENINMINNTSTSVIIPENMSSFELCSSGISGTTAPIISCVSKRLTIYATGYNTYISANSIDLIQEASVSIYISGEPIYILPGAFVSSDESRNSFLEYIYSGNSGYLYAEQTGYTPKNGNVRLVRLSVDILQFAGNCSDTAEYLLANGKGSDATLSGLDSSTKNVCGTYSEYNRITWISDSGDDTSTFSIIKNDESSTNFSLTGQNGTVQIPRIMCGPGTFFQIIFLSGTASGNTIIKLS